jgi:hypothetical protein
MTGIPGRDLVGLLGISGVQEIVLHASSSPAEQMKQGILDGVAAWRNGFRRMTFRSCWCTFADPN